MQLFNIHFVDVKWSFGDVMIIFMIGYTLWIYVCSYLRFVRCIMVPEGLMIIFVMGYVLWGFATQRSQGVGC